MTTVAVPGRPGKYHVLFNGSSLPCFNDTDCPGAGLCAINQTWATAPGGFCMCYSRGGLQGEGCSRLCALGGARIGIAAVIIALSFGASLVSLAALLSQTRSRCGRFFNVVNVILLSIGVGATFMMAYQMMMLVSTVGFPSSFVVLQDSTGRWLRRSPPQVDYATYILLVLSQSSSACAPLLLPLIWSQMASSIFSMRRRPIRAVQIISIGFCLVVLFVQIPLNVLAVYNFQGRVAFHVKIITAIWYAVYCFIVLVNIFAAVKIVFAIREIRGRLATEISDRFVHLLQRVLKTAIVLVILVSCRIGLISVQSKKIRTYYNDPTCNIVGGSVYTLSELTLEIAFLCLILTSLNVVRMITIMTSAQIEVDLPKTDKRVDQLQRDYDMSLRGVTDSPSVVVARSRRSLSKNEIIVI